MNRFNKKNLNLSHDDRTRGALAKQVVDLEEAYWELRDKYVARELEIRRLKKIIWVDLKPRIAELEQGDRVVHLTEHGQKECPVKQVDKGRIQRNDNRKETEP